MGFSLGAVIDAKVREAAEVLNNADAWYPAIDSGGGIREGAWVAEATNLVDLASWPAGTRLILRKERPHPGAQLTFTDTDGHRITGFLTDTGDWEDSGPTRRARTAASPTRPRRGPDPPSQSHRPANLPFNAFDGNAAWLEIIMAATDLIAWTKLIGFTDHPELARCEIETFRYRVCTSPPASPARPTTSAAHRRHLALGTRPRHRLADHPRRVHLTPRSLTTRRKTHRPWKARPQATPATCHTRMPQSYPQTGQKPVHTVPPSRTQNRG